MPSKEYKVMWKFPNQRIERGDYSATDLDYLKRILYQSERVSEDTTDELYIHEYCPDGSILEVLAHDKNIKPNNVVHADFTKKEKPRIKLSLPAPSGEPVKPKRMVVAGNGLWEAYEDA